MKKRVLLLGKPAGGGFGLSKLTNEETCAPAGQASRGQGAGFVVVKLNYERVLTP